MRPLFPLSGDTMSRSAIELDKGQNPKHFEPLKRKLILTFLVVILASVSMHVMNSTADTYLEVAEAEALMEAHLVDLAVAGNSITLTFRFNNESTLTLVLINVQFNMYANREFMGNYDMREKITLGKGDTDIEITIEIDSHYVENLAGSDTTVESYLLKKSIQWQMVGAAVIELPFGEDESYNVRIREQWVST